MPTHTPDWADGDAHDPGISLLALFAFLGVGIGGIVLRDRAQRAPSGVAVIGLAIGAAACAAANKRSRRRSRSVRPERD